MGALAPVTPWIPQDDLLLKNAIEAGASLESLAKGAVQFSRRFTIRELQDRWHSLLYDPNISAEASSGMIEFERSASNLPSKSGRADTSKETKCTKGKRKAESVRRCYYAMRKRKCNEPLPGDLGFLVHPDNFISGCEAPGPNNMLGHPIENHFGLEVANIGDLHHVFPQDIRNSAATCAVGDFPIGQYDTLEVPIEQNTVKEIPHVLGNNMAIDGNCTGIGKIDSSKELAGHGIFEANGIEPNPECNTKEIMCSGFGGNTIFNSPNSDCATSYHHLQYTSPPPAMPDWKPVERIPGSEMPDDVSIRRNNVQDEDPFGICDDGGVSKGTSEYDVISVKTKFNNHMSCDDLKNSTGCTEGFFDELSDTLFNFTPCDKEILNIVGEKDVIDKSFYDGLSLLLNSPDDANADNMPIMPEKQEAAAPGAYPDIPSSTGHEDNITGDTHLGDIDPQSNSETQVPASVSIINPQFQELCDGVICCTLNTEDPDIPCNDDIVLPIKPRPASARRTQNEANNPALPGKDNTGNQTSEKGYSTMKREPTRLGESHPASQARGQEMGRNHTVDEFGVKFETTRGESLNGSSKPGSSYGGPCQSDLAVKKEPSNPLLVRQPGCDADKTGHDSDLDHLQAGVGGVNQQGQASLAMRNQEFYAPGSADPMVIEPGGELLQSDPEEPFSESDTDIPYFSDIESMILDMDLGPDDQDSFSCREVTKYQQENAKRAIIRLEQNAHSYMQRAIASHRAFAILYGRHSKHYIKKAEVLLGRATDGVVVDIDLAREGRANTISRRQAIIKLDKDGTFNLMNLGKRPIYVNNKEVFRGQCLNLLSKCLIEIQGMPFIFDTNQAYVREYLDNAARKSEAIPFDV